MEESDSKFLKFIVRGDPLRFRHYSKAITKHPDFVGKEGLPTRCESTEQLAEIRRRIKHHLSFHEGEFFLDDIVMCELYEAVDAFKHEDYKSAYDEVYDLIAICDRMLVRIAKIMNQKKEGDKL